MTKSNATPFREDSLQVDRDVERGDDSSPAAESEVPNVPAQISGVNSGSAAPDLDRLQRWMFNVVIHPDGVRQALRTARAQEYYDVDESRLEELVLPSEGLTAADRMQIYSNCYTWRLTEVLEEEFPSVRAFLGEDGFYHLAKDYLDLHPSQHYSLQLLGQKFSQFLRQREGLEHHEFLADVATVERSMEDVFSEKQAPQISPEEFLAVPVEKWSDIAFRLIPALQIHRLSYPVNPFMTAIRSGGEMSVPKPQESCVLVYRKDYRSWRADVSSEQFEVLSILREGLSLGQAFERCAGLDSFDLASFVEKLPSTFQEWTAEGIFSEMVDTSDGGGT